MCVLSTASDLMRFPYCEGQISIYLLAIITTQEDSIRARTILSISTVGSAVLVR